MKNHQDLVCILLQLVNVQGSGDVSSSHPMALFWAQSSSLALITGNTNWGFCSSSKPCSPEAVFQLQPSLYVAAQQSSILSQLLFPSLVPDSFPFKGLLIPPNLLPAPMATQGHRLDTLESCSSAFSAITGDGVLWS